MPRAVLAAAGIVLCALACPAAADVVVGRDARTAVVLTVYSGGDLALVRETRTVDLGSGEQTLRFEDVAAKLDPRSVGLRAIDDGGTLAVLEQSFLFDLASPQAAVERWVGRGVELVETDERLRARVTPATLLSTEGGNVYRIGDRIAVNHPGWLLLPPTGEEVFTRPTLRWRIGNQGAPRRTLEASYVTGGLSWAADYVLVLAADDTRAELSGWATLANRSGVRYDDAALVLVADEVHRAGQPPRPFPAMEERTMAAPAPSPPAPEAFAEYYRYAFERGTSLAENESKQLALLAPQNVTVAKRYELRGEPFWFRQPTNDRDRRVPVSVLLTVANTADNGLGRDLPAGTVRVYQEDASGGWVLAGEDRLRHTARSETVTLEQGRAADVVATRTQTDWRKVDVEPWQAESAWEVTLRNEKSAAVTVVVRERIDGTWQVLESSLPARKVDAHTLGIDVPVPAGGETTLRYRIQVGR